MKNRWKNVNRELRKALSEEDLAKCLESFREDLKKTQKEGELDLLASYRDLRAQMMNNVRVNLCLLDAAAHEESLLIKKEKQ